MERSHIPADSIEKSLKDFARGLAGGLLFSLPMLYTSELWQTGFTAGPAQLFLYMMVGLLLLLGYNQFVGIHRPHTLREGLEDSVEEMGMGLLITAVILWLLGRLEPQMSMEEIMGKIVVESLTVAIGISVGKAQLGTPGEDTEEENPKEVTKSNGPAKHLFGNHLVMAICGAVLVAANVAPTEEIVQIAVETAPYKLLIISLVSLGIGGMVLYYSDFKGSTKSAGKWDVFTGIVIMYTVSLLVSAFMLWFFGRFAGASLAVIMSETVVLAFPAALGASAGRLLLQT